jgi:ABC-type dipeptide/oligopeptide/nickel transport system permease subunit
MAASIHENPPPKSLTGLFALDTSGRLGAGIVLLFLLIATCVWLGWLGQDWSDASGGRWAPPGADYWLGTNVVGQDILERAIYSTGTAFRVGLSVAVLATMLGAFLGSISGWYSGSWLDDGILWITAVLDSIPFYLFVAALAYAMQGNAWAMQLAMIVTFWTSTSRLIRGEVMRLRHREFIRATEAIGLPLRLILLRHVLPNTAHILLVQLAITFVAAIKAEVILSFLGLGIIDGVSWGLMLAESTQEVLAGQFANFITASTLLFLLLLGFNLMTDSVDRAMDPRRRDG